MTNEQIESIYNATFGGLTLYYRDANLSDTLISKYQVGNILMEKGFTDMSSKGGGLSANVRFLIASANAKNVSLINPDAHYASHFILASNTYFKVLDIYTIGNKTQLFLLEIPAQSIDLFAKAISNIEDQIIVKARESLDNKINTEPIKELETAEWRERTAFPIGMTDDGELFYNDPNDPKAKKPWWKLG